ncbi:type VII secretion integral membrane protein EccD [Corynebacterium poyangense]|nr:type VII secretion integral membrane protein EccD [Corynebacterium poyangense]
MITDHVVRLTIRIHVGNYHREADLAIPTSSTLAEVLGDITALCNAPKIDRPWQVATVTGQLFDQTRPLAALGVHHGDILVLSPRLESEMPVLRDAAEALVHRSPNPSLHLENYLPFAATILSMWVLLALALDSVPYWSRIFLLTLGLIAIHYRSQHNLLLSVSTVVSALSTGFLFAIPELHLPHGQQLAWALVAALACGGVVLMLLNFSSTVNIALNAVAMVCAVAGLMSAIALGSGLSYRGLAAMLVLVAVLIPLTAPHAAIYLAGLKVPRLPSPGQAFTIADEQIPDIDGKVERAEKLHDGFLAGATLCMVPAIIALGWNGDGWVVALCVSCSIAISIHALRYRRPGGTLALSLMALGCIIALILAVIHAGFVTWALALCLGLCLFLCAAPLWAAHLARLQPTTLVWFERAESIALALSIPLTLHLMGLFGFIRGLG